MKHGSGLRFLALSATLALFFGCKDDGDDGGAASGPGGGLHGEAGPIPFLEFFDDFSGSFPGPHWEIRNGNPFTSSNVGNKPPGLALLSFGHKARVRSEATFSSSEPLTLSFDLANPEWTCDSRFKFRVRDAGSDAGEASFEIRHDQDEIRLRIEGAYAEVDYSSDGAYHAVKFTIDAARTATWWIDGKARLARNDFPGGVVELEMESTGEPVTKFVVDNVKVTRP